MKEVSSQPVEASLAASQDLKMETEISQDIKPVKSIVPGADQSQNNIQGALSAQKTTVPLTIQYGPTLRSYTELPVTIGKGTTCDFIVDHASIYDQHARLFFTNNQYWVEDITGQNILQVNSRSVAQAPLNINDEISLCPDGPVFLFLGEGRFAEITKSPIDEPAPIIEEKKEAKDILKENSANKILSKLKRIWPSK